MFRLGVENSWFCSDGFDHNIDFCFWVLEVDGLRVPPFTAHPEGDGLLRAAGLDAAGWLTWTHGVVQQQDQQTYTYQKASLRLTNEIWKAFNTDSDTSQEQTLQRMQAFNEQLVEAKRARGLLFPEIIKPVETWNGSTGVRERLSELWSQYQSVLNARRSWERNLTHQWRSSRDNQPAPNLWHELKPYHNRLPSLFIHFVPYAVEIDYTIPPFSIIMTIVGGQLAREAFSKRTMQAAEVLCQNKA